MRLATRADLEAVADIYNREVETSTSTLDTQPRVGTAAEAWFEEHQSQLFPLVVAESDGEVVGWGALTRWSPRGGYRHTVEGSVFVREGFRGRGVGSLLTRELISRAASAGHRVLIARVGTTNRASRDLLLASGFRSVGVMHGVGHKLGTWLDVEILELQLRDPDRAEADGPRSSLNVTERPRCRCR